MVDSIRRERSDRSEIVRIAHNEGTDGKGERRCPQNSIGVGVPRQAAQA